MKLIHAADIHLDTCFAEPGLPLEYGARRRRQLRDSFAGMLRHAWEGRFDAVLLAGDLFDLKYVTRETVVFLREQLERIAPIPVFIAPGNRDPYTPESPYAVESWPSNVVIFNGPDWTSWTHPELPLTVHGFGFNAKDVPGEVFCRLRLPRDGRIQVAVAHGAERDFLPSDHKPRALFSLSDVLQPGLSYLALGHVHRTMALFEDDQCQAWYSGPLEGHDFDEAGPTGFLEVEITPGEAERAAAVRVQAVPGSPRQYWTITADMTESADPVALVAAALAPVDHSRDAAVRLRLRGGATADALCAVREAVWVAADRFAWLVLEDHMETVEDYAAMAREDTVLGELVRGLLQARRDADDPARHALLTRSLEAGVAAFLGRPLSAGMPDGGLG